jgi:hypothetical protein
MIVTAATLILLVAGCGDDDDGGGVGGATDPAAANSCEELADVVLNIFQEAIDEVDQMDIADFTSDEAPEAIQRLETLGDQLDSRASELGCSDAEGERLVCDRIDRLTAENQVGEIFLAQIQSEC